MSTRPEGWQKAEKPEGWGKRAPSPTSIKFKHTATHAENVEQPVKQNRRAPKSVELPDTNKARSTPPVAPVRVEQPAHPIPKHSDTAVDILPDTKSTKPDEVVFEKPAGKAPPEAKPQKEAAAKPKKAETAPKKKKLTVLWISLAALAVVGGILCWLILQKDGGKAPYGSVPSATAPEPTSAPSAPQSEPTAPSETQPEPTVPSETQPEPTVPSETQPEPAAPSESQPEPTAPSESQPEPVADLSRFAGCWHVSSDLAFDGGVRDRELYITRIDEDLCIFNLWYYRTNSVEDVVAEIHGNTATFVHVGYDGESVMEGSLTFGEATVTLTITASDFAHMPAETIAFDAKHDDSWGYSSWPLPSNPEEDLDTSPSEPNKTTKRIEVNGVTFEYLSTFSGNGLTFTMNNITIEESYVGYSIKIDAEIVDPANRRKYFTYRAYDSDGYLLAEKSLSASPVNSGAVKSAYEIVVVYPMRPSYIYIGMTLFG